MGPSSHPRPAPSPSVLRPQAGHLQTNYCLFRPGSYLSFSQCCCVFENDFTQVKRLVLRRQLRKIIFVSLRFHLLIA